jgi:hypothetical protein
LTGLKAHAAIMEEAARIPNQGPDKWDCYIVWVGFEDSCAPAK